MEYVLRGIDTWYRGAVDLSCKSDILDKGSSDVLKTHFGFCGLATHTHQDVNRVHSKTQLPFEWPSHLLTGEGWRAFLDEVGDEPAVCILEIGGPEGSVFHLDIQFTVPERIEALATSLKISTFIPDPNPVSANS